MWREGYVTEIPYTVGFYHHLSPIYLNLCLLAYQIQGVDLSQRFTYCELACGRGLTTNLLASVYPQGQFYGMDFNPVHIAYGRRLAAQAGLTNVHFSDHSFREYLEADLPEFDFIVLHGIYSWVSEENQRYIREFIRRRLKVGGVVYISYNCRPGWESVVPVQKLLQVEGSRVGGPALRRLQAGLQLLQQLRQLGALYLQHPWLAQRLDLLQKQDPAYLVHEFFNQHWAPLWVDEVLGCMGELGLTYVGQADLTEAVDLFYLPPAVMEFLQQFPELQVRELLRDFCLNRQFRRDVYVKGALPIDGATWQELWRSLAFVLIVPLEVVQLEHQTTAGQVTLKPELYRPLAEYLSKGPVTVERLLGLLGPEGGFGSVIQALLLLTGLGYAHPVWEGPSQGAAHFNQAVIQSIERDGSLLFLASPLVGNGLRVNLMDLLFLLAEQRQQHPVEFAVNFLKERGLKLIKDGQAVEEEALTRQMLQEQVDPFLRSTRPLLKGLGI